MELETMRIETKKNDRGFFFIDFGSQAHGRRSFRLWINRKLITPEASEQTHCGNMRKYGEHVEFPVSAEIKKTEKGTLVLRPAESRRVFYAFKDCGFRGSSSLEVLEPSEYKVLHFYVYRSPLGATGVSEGMLIEIPNEERLVYKWSRSGRLYGSEKNGLVEIEPDLTIKETTGLADGLDELEELENELNE